MRTAFALERQADPHSDYLYKGIPFSKDIRGLQGLSEEDIEDYRNQGYLVVRQAFTPEEAVAARDELQVMCAADDPECTSVHFEYSIADELGGRGLDITKIDRNNEKDLERLRETALAMDPALRAGFVRKFVGFTKAHPPLRALSHSSALRSVLRRLTGEKMKLFVSQALIKPPGGREKPWHQDHAYFDLPVDTPIVGVWIALDEATPENGCMHVWPGGHRSGPRMHFHIRDWQLCDTDIAEAPVVSVPLSTGDLLLFDGKLPHGTPTNGSDTQRWAVQYHYIPSTVTKVDKSVRLAAFGADGKDVYC